MRFAGAVSGRARGCGRGGLSPVVEGPPPPSCVTAIEGRASAALELRSDRGAGLVPLPAGLTWLRRARARLRLTPAVPVPTKPPRNCAAALPWRVCGRERAPLPRERTLPGLVRPCDVAARCGGGGTLRTCLCGPLCVWCVAVPSSSPRTRCIAAHTPASSVSSSTAAAVASRTASSSSSSPDERSGGTPLSGADSGRPPRRLRAR